MNEIERLRRPNFFTITEGEFKGWSTYSKSIIAKHTDNADIIGAIDSDPNEELMGPFYFRQIETGGQECMFIPTNRHNNNGGMTHGGALMTFADFALFAHTYHVRDTPAVTVQFDAQFINGSHAGVPLISHGEVIRNTKDLIFVRGIITQSDKTILSYSGIIKRVRPKT